MFRQSAVHHTALAVVFSVMLAGGALADERGTAAGGTNPPPQAKTLPGQSERKVVASATNLALTRNPPATVTSASAALAFPPSRANAGQPETISPTASPVTPKPVPQNLSGPKSPTTPARQSGQGTNQSLPVGDSTKATGVRPPALPARRSSETPRPLPSHRKTLVRQEARLPRIGDGNGTVVLLGGNLAVDNLELFSPVRRYLDRERHSFLRGRKPVRIAVIGTAKATLAEAWEVYSQADPDDPYGSPSYFHWFRRLGFEPVYVPIAPDAVASNPALPFHKILVQKVKSCHVIFFTGGDQSRNAACLLTPEGKPTALLSAIRDVHAAGGVVMGTSAGAHFLCDPMFGFGLSLETLRANGLEAPDLAPVLAGRDLETRIKDNSLRLPGFGLLPPGFLTDTHFDARGRLGRLLVGMRDVRARWGIGVDEDTALYFEDGRGEVKGRQGVFVVEAGPEAFAGSTRAFQAHGLRLSYLTTGDTFDFPREKGFSAKFPAAGDASRLTSSTDVFGSLFDAGDNRLHPFETTRLLREFACSGAPQVEGVTGGGGPAFRLRLTRDGETHCTWDGPSHFAVFGARLDLEPLDP